MAKDKFRIAAHERLSRDIYDVAIVGGGINGAVASAVLSAAGLKVLLVEKHDFASGTSQESSNLVWGGIKYLESYELGLVWNLCYSRNELMRSYPETVRELRFLTCLERGFRKPRMLVFLGACLYWFMGRFQTKFPQLLSRRDIEHEEPLIETTNSQGGLEYSDCYLIDNDARFVFHFIRRAMQSGAEMLNYVELKGLKKGQNLWNLDLRDRVLDQAVTAQARVLINASGPFADKLNGLAGVTTKHKHIFSKGVHLIVRRLTDSDKVLTFFADDGRLFFVIPMGSCSCIGTTDTRVEHIPAKVEASDRQFILDNINKRLNLRSPLTLADIISERCGVRPLVVGAKLGQLEQEDWINLSRKHILAIDRAQHHITIFGGKLTDCLNIGRELQEVLRTFGFKMRRQASWFGEGAPSVKALVHRESIALGLHKLHYVGEGTQADRLWRTYGEDALLILNILREEQELWKPVVEGFPILLAEVKHMQLAEMVTNLEDFLRRRTRLALVVPRQQLQESSGLRAACSLLFGEAADACWNAYFTARDACVP